MTNVRSSGLYPPLLPLTHFFSLGTFFDLPFLIGAGGGIHWHQVNSIVAQNQLVRLL